MRSREGYAGDRRRGGARLEEERAGQYSHRVLLLEHVDASSPGGSLPSFLSGAEARALAPAQAARPMGSNRTAVVSAVRRLEPGDLPS